MTTPNQSCTGVPPVAAASCTGVPPVVAVPATIGGMFKLAADLRSDARLDALNETQWGELFQVISSGDKKGFKKFLADHGITLAPQNIDRQRKTLAAAAQRMLARSQTLAEARKLADQNKITLTGAALEQAVVAVGDLLDASVDPASAEGQALLLNALKGLTGARKVELTADALAQAERKLKAVEDKLARIAAATQQARDKGGALSDTDRQAVLDRVDEIMGVRKSK